MSIVGGFIGIFIMLGFPPVFVLLARKQAKKYELKMYNNHLKSSFKSNLYIVAILLVCVFDYCVIIAMQFSTTKIK